MSFCEKCGSQTTIGSSFCGSCGNAVRQVGSASTGHSAAKPTAAWYLVAFFFNILGGILGYFAVRNDDRQMANRLLIIGLVMFVLIVVTGTLVPLMIIRSLASR